MATGFRLSTAEKLGGFACSFVSFALSGIADHSQDLGEKVNPEGVARLTKVRPSERLGTDTITAECIEQMGKGGRPHVPEKRVDESSIRQTRWVSAHAVRGWPVVPPSNQLGSDGGSVLAADELDDAERISPVTAAIEERRDRRKHLGGSSNHFVLQLGPL